MGQIVEEIFCDGVAESAGVWRKGPGEWTTAGPLDGTDESAGCSDLWEIRIVFLCHWVRRRFWYALASASLMRLPSSLLSGRSLHSYSLTTSQPSSVESAIKISLFPGGSFFSPSFSSSTAFSNCGGVDQRNEEVDWNRDKLLFVYSTLKIRQIGSTHTGSRLITVRCIETVWWIFRSIFMIVVLNIGLFVLFDLSVNSSWNSVQLSFKFRLL